jgi:ribosomal-protein-alanine N-acetyltransferase
MAADIQTPEDGKRQGKVIATTPRLRVRRMIDSDAAFYCTLLNDPDYSANIGDRQIDSEQAALANMRERLYHSYDKHGFGMYLLERKSDGAAIGMAGLVKRDFLEDVDLGYALLPIGRRQGFATEAAQALLPHARDEIGLSRLAAITAMDNAASQGVLERLGFSPAGTISFPDEDEICAYFLLELLEL